MLRVWNDSLQPTTTDEPPNDNEQPINVQYNQVASIDSAF